MAHKLPLLSRAFRHALQQSLVALVLFMGIDSGHVVAQTAAVSALTGQSCAGTRAAKNLGCTANDFAVGLQFTQPSLGAIQNCIAGQYINVSVIATISSGSPDRYDVGLFIGESGNDPQLELTGPNNLCSIGVFPTTPLPFFENSTQNPSQCGDFRGSSSATFQVSNVRVLCTPVAGSNLLKIPYVVAWNNQTINTCTAADTTSTFGNLTANTNSKCTASEAAGVTGVAVQGYVVITKATNPGDSTQTFNFTASSPGTTNVTPVSFSLSNGQSQTVQMALSTSGGTQNLVITESAQTGWSTTASITCTQLDNSTASFVTTSNANRQITATLSATNFAAKCTVTNTRLPRVRLIKAVEPSGAPGAFNLSVRTDLGTATASNVGSGGSTSYQISNPVAVTLTESAGTSTTLTEYLSSISCINDSTSASVSVTTSTLTGLTRTAVLTPPNLVDTSCTFTNTRAANLSLTKTNGTDTLAAGSTTTYTIVATNAGPAPADGAVLRDPAAAGLSCTAVSCTASSGGAACPASPTIAALQGSGIVLGTFPASSSLTFSVQCTVTATGL